jgi:hypothetical protein
MASKLWKKPNNPTKSKSCSVIKIPRHKFRVFFLFIHCSPKEYGCNKETLSPFVFPKPRLTGLRQIRVRGGLTIEKKLELDVQYADSQSLWLDTKIIFLTVIHLVWPRGIYEKRYSKDQETRHSTG